MPGVRLSDWIMRHAEAIDRILEFPVTRAFFEERSELELARVEIAQQRFFERTLVHRRIVSHISPASNRLGRVQIACVARTSLSGTDPSLEGPPHIRTSGQRSAPFGQTTAP
jgi:hypothetical protein